MPKTDVRALMTPCGSLRGPSGGREPEAVGTIGVGEGGGQPQVDPQLAQFAAARDEGRFLRREAGMQDAARFD